MNSSPVKNIKTIAIWVLLLWIGLVAENARPDLLPTFSLISALAVGCLFWLHSSPGIILAGSAFIVNGMLHPTLLPVEGPALLTAFCVVIARHNRRIAATGHTTSTAQWLDPLLVLVTGLTARSVFTSHGDLSQVLTDLRAAMFVAVPVLSAVLLLMRAADEFGFRRTISVRGF